MTTTMTMTMTTRGTLPKPLSFHHSFIIFLVQLFLTTIGVVDHVGGGFGVSSGNAIYYVNGFTASTRTRSSWNNGGGDDDDDDGIIRKNRRRRQARHCIIRYNHGPLFGSTTTTITGSAGVVLSSPPTRSPRSSSSSSSSLSSLRSSPSSSQTTSTKTTSLSSPFLDESLISSLDLIPLLEGVARHTGTKRGHDAVLSLVGIDNGNNGNSKNDRTKQYHNVNKRHDDNGDLSTSSTTTMMMDLATRIAPSKDEAIQMYQLTQEAMSLLELSLKMSKSSSSSSNSSSKGSTTGSSSTTTATTTDSNDDDDESSYYFYPPIYAMESNPWDTTTIVSSDDDEWLYLGQNKNGRSSSRWSSSGSSRDGTDSWTVEHLLQAEQVIRRLLNVKEWGSVPQHETNNVDHSYDYQDAASIAAPTLYELARSIDLDDQLRPVYEMISGSVEIVRARSLTDPNGKSSYQIRLCSSKFPTLHILETKLNDMISLDGAKEFDRQVVELRTEIESTQDQIVSGLAQQIISISQHVQDGLDIVTCLDVIMAKAAYGMTLNGRIPTIHDQNVIFVPNFLHPVLMDQAADPSNVVPIDLMLSASPNQSSNSPSGVGPDESQDHHQHHQDREQQRALIISGANGGGKTAALKSFGLVSLLSKLGIPIPQGAASTTATTTTANSADRTNDLPPSPRVDYFDHIVANIGDRQNLINGESTWTSVINSCSRTINRLAEGQRSNVCDNDDDGDGMNPDPKWLVLMDELGSGTDPEAGGAIAQAILEEILSFETSSLVATTHSPRLKALSFNNATYGCASVLTHGGKDDGFDDGDDDVDDTSSTDMKFKRPSFKLEYGIIGESDALGAASRSRPSLPSRVLSRAADLVSDSTGDTEGRTKGDYILALTNSMEKQVQKQETSQIEMDQLIQNANECQRATIALASSFQTYVDRMDDRLESVYRKLKDRTGSADMEVVGETLAEIRLVKKDVMTKKEKLASQGLQMVSVDRILRPGESVVIVSEGGKWDGISAQFVADSTTDSTLKQTEVLVKPSFAMEPWSWNEDEEESKRDYDPIKDRFLIVERHELAEWCDVDTSLESSSSFSTTTSVSDSKQKLNSLMSSLNSVSSSSSSKRTSSKNGKKKSSSAFRSSRERKAAKKKRK